MVTLVTKPHPDREQRTFDCEHSLAEKMLRKSNHKQYGWTLQEDSGYKFEGGSLLQKAKPKKTKPAKETPNVVDSGAEPGGEE